MPGPNDARWQRRFRRLLLFVGTATSFYLVSSYILDRLREARARAIKEKREKDLMRGHFQSLQNTINFTIYALLPTLQPQLESAYPVEAISQVLQSKSSGSLGDSSLSSVEPTPEGSVLLQDTPKSPQSEVGLLQAAGESSDHAAVGESWASEFKQGHDHENVDPASPTQASIDGSMLHAPSGDEASSTMSQSISLPPTDASSSSASPPSDLSQSAMLHPSPPRPPVDPAITQLEGKSKKELWRELKLQTLTRSLTTAYLLPLLYLLTSSQLSTLARLRYLEDVKRSNNPDQPTEEEEDRPAPHPRSKTGLLGYFSIPSMGLGDFIESATPIIDPRSYIPTGVSNWIPFLPSIPFLGSSSEADPAVLVSAVMRDRQAQLEEERMEDEKTYLTYSWWILQEGWRHLAKRVEVAVEEVFGHVGLKANVDLPQWQELLREVRARVETISVDGAASLYSFTEHILPPDPISDLSSTEACPLPPSVPPNRPHLAYLLAQTASHLSSPDANYLIEKGVSAMTQNLLLSLEGGLQSSAGEGRARLVDSLPAISRWSKNVWEGIPDSGVEGLLGLPEYEGFAALVFGDWAPVESP